MTDVVAAEVVGLEHGDIVAGLARIRPGAKYQLQGTLLTWESTDLTRPADSDIAAAAALPSVPVSVHSWQLKAALAAAGKLDAANAAVAAAAAGSPTLAIAWASAPEISRDSPGANAIATAIGYDQAGADALFIAADKIAV